MGGRADASPIFTATLDAHQAISVAAPTPPDAPTGLSAAPGNGEVTLSWIAPAFDGGLPVVRYRVYESTIDHFTPTTPVESPTATSTSATVPGLANGTTYYFLVIAVNDADENDGASPASNQASATPAAPPGAPTGLSATAENGKVNLSWTAPASDGGVPVTSYRVYDSTTSGFAPGAPVQSPDGTSATVTSLANGTIYYFLVTAVNGDNEASSASGQASATPVGPPGAPTGLNAAAENGEVNLSWTAPASDGGASVTSYDIYDSTTSGFTLGAPPERSAGTSTSVTGLANGTTYYFRVTAVNQAGQSSASAQTSATLATSVTRAAPPGAPTVLRAVAEDGEVSLSWTAPASDGGAPLTSYDIYDSTTSGFTPGTLAETSAGTSTTVTGLANGTTYYFLVTAVNQAGQGPASAQASARPDKTIVKLPSPRPSKTIVPPPPRRSVPKQLIGLLAGVGTVAVAGGLALATRGRRLNARSPRHVTPASQVRAEPGPRPPDAVHIRKTGTEPTHTIRFEPNHGTTTTTIKEKP
jgi:predicted phage tail protein